jgi:ArsR family transcriptional regulator
MSHKIFGLDTNQVDDFLQAIALSKRFLRDIDVMTEINHLNFNDQDLFIDNESDINQASRALKAMGHPLRLKILCILASHKEASVQDLVDFVGTSQSNISQHLSILREKGVLDSRKDANKVYYHIMNDKIVNLMGSMKDAFCHHED